MRHPNTLAPENAALVIVDMQEAFRPAISDFAETATRIALTAHAAQLLQLPIIVTEQVPQKLGCTASEIQAVLSSAFDPIEKNSFSACGAPAFLAQLERTQARHILLCGIEAHICVNQTAHDLLALNLKVHLLIDCITARHAHNINPALNKMHTSGALPATIELALFELMRDATHEQFRAIQKLIK